MDHALSRLGCKRRQSMVSDGGRGGGKVVFEKKENMRVAQMMLTDRRK